MVLSVSLLSNAQTGSPYSNMGIGDIKHNAFSQSKAMGGVGIGLRTNAHININNPATYSLLDSNRVIYEVGVRGELNQLKSGGVKELHKNGGIDYFAIAFKTMDRWGMSMGLIQSSDVNYLINIEHTNPYSGRINNAYYGEGGIYSVYWGNAFEIIKNKLSVGLNLSYNFGSIKKIKNTIFLEDSYAYNSKFYEQNNFYGFTINTGVQYTFDLGKHKTTTIGLTYANKMKLNTKVNILGGTLTNNESSQENIKQIVQGELRDTICNIIDQEDKFDLPQKIGIGITYQDKNKFIVGADFIYSDWSTIKSVNKFNNQMAVRIGAEFIPNYNSINNYFKRVNYRVGAYARQSYLTINNNNINDYGMTFGLGLPLKGSSINIGFEFGERSSTDKNILKERYGILTLNLSLMDIWFLKRKYR